MPQYHTTETYASASEEAFDALRFDAALAPDLAIEARWTSCGRAYTAQATITKVNTKSVRVRLEEAIDTPAAGILYPRGHALALPRLAAKEYSANNGAYPLPDPSELDLVHPPVLDTPAAAPEADAPHGPEALEDPAAPAAALHPEDVQWLDSLDGQTPPDDGDVDTPAAQVYQLLCGGLTAIQQALDDGRLRWRPTPQRPRQPRQPKQPGQLPSAHHKTLLQQYVHQTFPPIRYSVRLHLVQAGYLARTTGPASDTLTDKGRTYCAAYVAQPTPA